MVLGSSKSVRSLCAIEQIYQFPFAFSQTGQNVKFTKGLDWRIINAYLGQSILSWSSTVRNVVRPFDLLNEDVKPDRPQKWICPLLRSKNWMTTVSGAERWTTCEGLDSLFAPSSVLLYEQIEKFLSKFATTRSIIKKADESSCNGRISRFCLWQACPSVKLPDFLIL